MYFVIIDIYQTNPDRMYVIETQINTQLLSECPKLLSFFMAVNFDEALKIKLQRGAIGGAAGFSFKFREMKY